MSGDGPAATGDDPAPGAGDEGRTPEPVVLERPREPLRPVVATLDELTRAREALTAGSGPLAVDTERAHGFRYSPRAYLLQFRRTGAGTFLVDPIAFADPAGARALVELADDLAGVEWTFHAASQDLPCLAELDVLPRTLFDTELAARLLGRPRVGLATLLEDEFGVVLRKEHSAADWSRRPLPREWLNYAALDVELLVELRERLEADLEAAGKAAWAREEFASLVDGARRPAPARTDPWRRTSGLHTVRNPRGLAVVRELWTERDRIAADSDRAPGRILPDRAIVALAAKADDQAHRVLGRDDLASVPEFSWRFAARYRANWQAALTRAGALTRDQLPSRQLPHEGPPPPRHWEGKFPDAAARWTFVRATLTELAERHDLPVENLLSPDLQRRLAWEPPRPLTRESVDHFLAGLGARAWQRTLVAPPLAAGMP